MTLSKIVKALLIFCSLYLQACIPRNTYNWDSKIIFHDSIPNEAKIQIYRIIDEVNRRFDENNSGLAFVPTEIGFWDSNYKDSFVVIGTYDRENNFGEKTEKAMLIIKYENGVCSYYSIQSMEEYLHPSEQF